MLKIFLISIIYICVCVLLYNSFIRPRREIPKAFVLCAAAVAAVMRIYFALSPYCFETDMNCFKAWGSLALTGGFGNMYSGEFFLDYPPGYIYILALLDGLRQLAGISYGSACANLIFKLPAMAADFGCAYLIYRFGKEKGLRRNMSLFLSGAFLFCPAVWFTSSVWGQIESWFCLLCMLSLYFAYKNKTVLCAVLYALAFVTKSQAILLGPVLMFYIFKRKSLKEFLTAVGTGLVSVYLVALPFCKSPFDLRWLVELYLNATSGYRNFTVNGYNLYYLLGLNWVDLGDNTVNSIVIPLVIILCGFIVWFAQNNDGLFTAGGVSILCIFAFCTMMHERYIFPAYLLFIFAYIVRRQSPYLFFALCSGVTGYINTAFALAVYHGPFHPDDTAARLVGFAVVLIALSAAAYSIYDTARESKDILKKLLAPKILVAGITVIYAVFALAGLGSAKAPQSFYQTTVNDKSFRVYFNDEVAEIDKIYVYNGVGDKAQNDGNRAICGQFSIFYAQDGKFEPLDNITEQSVFTWKEYNADISTHEVLIQADFPGQVLYEIAFFDKNGDIIPYTVTDADTSNPYSAVNANDEQDTVPEYINYYNSMYFDEIYHGRTAYEQLHGQPIYETTHPPLGKILISIGVALFGMTPFGWRIVGALCGVAMIPVIYMLVKELCRKPFPAVIAAALLAVDFMHLTQTRIATVDTYVVLFSLLTFLFMARYAGAKPGDQKSEWTNLTLSGAFMGCAVASKWNGAYPMVGLAIFFFTALFLKYRKRDAICRTRSQNAENADIRETFCETDCSSLTNALSKSDKYYIAQTLAFCVVVFVLLPLAIYSLSFIPVIEADGFTDYLNKLWSYQVNMYEYHAYLDAEHFFSSMWYTWFWNAKPIWYAINEWGGAVSSISAFGNPLIWIFTPVGAAYCLYSGIKKKNYGYLLPALGYFASYLPWVLVTRLCFIYHYFPCAVFGICCMAMLISDFTEARPKLKKPLWIYLALCGLLFILFLPVLTGTGAPKAYIDFLEFLPDWYFVN